jgi:electron transport complex protein RnfA
MVLQKTMPSLYRALGIYLPLITTNCAVLGDPSSTFDQNGYNFIRGNRFTALRRRWALPSPLCCLRRSGKNSVSAIDIKYKCFEGFPIALVTTAFDVDCVHGISGAQGILKFIIWMGGNSFD